MPIWRPLLAGLLVIATPTFASAEGVADGDPYAALHEQDLRLAQIAERIQGANLALCRNIMPLTGMILHSADQYQSPQAEWFAGSDVATAAIIPGSAADLAGMQANDGLIAIHRMALEDRPIIAGEPRRDTIFNWLAETGIDSSIQIQLRRGDQTTEVDLAPTWGCYSLVEVLSQNEKLARSDGRVVQISYGMADMLSADQLAAVFAHELAHAVLEHRRRLEEAGIRDGLLGEFGRNRRIAREVEVEADRLSVHLLANAGYEPSIAPQFWRSEQGEELGHGFFRSRRYPSRIRRAELMEAEIESHLSELDGPSLPAHLLDKRQLPFSD